MKDEDFTGSSQWSTLKEAHENVHCLTQDVTELYAGAKSNDEIFTITNGVEKNIEIVFNSLDKLREEKCTKMKKSKS